MIVKNHSGKQMTLRRKLYITITLTFLTLTLILVFFSYHILIKGIKEIESEDARGNLEGVLTILNQQLSALDTNTRDYASWDDMCNFIATRSRAFLKSNFVPATFSNLKINFALILDRNGNIVHTAGFDLESLKSIPVDKSVLENRRAIHERVFSSAEAKPLRGIITLPTGLALLTAHPILPSNLQGKPHGLLIIGRFLDQRQVTRLGEPLRLGVALYRLDRSDLPPEIVSAQKLLSPEQRLAIKPKNGKAIAGYALLTDIFGKDSLLLETTGNRAIFRQGMNTVIYLVAFVIFTALVFTVVLGLILERSVIRRILRISEDVRAVEADGNMNLRIQAEGNDEIAGLGKDINSMLEKLETSEDCIRREAEKYRTVVEDQTEFICRFDTDGILSFVNDAYYRFFGYRRQSMIGRHFLSFVPDDDRRNIFKWLETLTPTSPTVSYDHRVIFPNGQEFWQHWTCRAIFADNGRIFEYQAVGRDITERKQTENKLAQLNSQLEEANAQLGQAYAKMKQNLDSLRKHLFKEEFAFLVDREGKIFGITERVLEHMQLSRNQMLEANMTDYLSPQDRPQFSEALRDAWIGITRQANIKLVQPHEEAAAQMFEVNFARLTLEGKRLLLVALR